MSTVQSASEPETEPGAGPTSPWAVASLLCSVAMCCPPMSLVGILLGVRAMVQINADPRLRGRNLAVAGIVLGVIAMLVWGGGAVWWHYHARIPMQQGPREPMQAGLAGDVQAFMNAFADDSVAGGPDEAREFLDKVHQRYGDLVSSRQSAVSTTIAAMSGPTEYRIPYTFEFRHKILEVEATFITFSPSTVLPQPVFRWRWIRLIDPQQGDLIYPVAAQSQATTPAPTPATPPSTAPSPAPSSTSSSPS